MKKALWLFESALFMILSMPFALMPLRWSIKSGEILGLLIFHLWVSRRKIAIENLRKSVELNAIRLQDQPEKVIRENFKNIGRSFVEIIKIYYGLGRKIIDSITIEGVEHFHRAHSRGKGVLLLSGHCGNWELFAITSSARFSGVAGIARPLNNPYLNRILERVRQKYGSSVIYKKGALRAAMEFLRKNGSVGVLMDQSVIPEEGFVIDFLGRGAWTSKVPALIARKTGAAVVPVFIHRTIDAHRITVYPEVELSALSEKESAVMEDTKRFSEFIENYIREHPSEWLWIHNRWKRVNA
jgi:KDO2-lipid IV(A) lauroyltransferase